MRRFRLSVLAMAILAALVSVILLLNITARNPTHHRYSSAPVQMSGNTADIGLSAERILAKDLRQPRNDEFDQRQCICNAPPPPRYPLPADCRVCIAFSQSVATYRRPDFVTPKYIAESKNHQELLYTHTNLVNQIGDYAIAARAMAVPLWVYVRVNTEVDPEHRRIVRSTGGDIIQYFTYPGYVDPVDYWARYVLVVSAAVILLFGAWEWGAAQIAKRPPRKPKPPKGTPRDAASRAADSVDYADDFLKRTTESSRRTLDEDAAREDFTKDPPPEE